jgi:micrococcal nuclease
MRRRNTKLRAINLISVIFFLLAAVFYLVNERYPFPSAQQGNEAVPVVTIHDGDTISVILHKKQEKLRLIGIDAPETGQNPWGEQAKQYLESVVQASKWKVTIETDAQKTDQYGRILAYVWTADGRLINLEMIKCGYAILYTVPPNVKYVAEFKKAQAEAREKRLGIWSENGLREKPHDYRKEHPRI